MATIHCSTHVAVNGGQAGEQAPAPPLTPLVQAPTLHPSNPGPYSPPLRSRPLPSTPQVRAPTLHPSGPGLPPQIQAPTLHPQAQRPLPRSRPLPSPLRGLKLTIEGQREGRRGCCVHTAEKQERATIRKRFQTQVAKLGHGFTQRGASTALQF